MHPQDRFLRLNADGEQTAADNYVAILDTNTNLIWSRETLPCGRVNHADAVKAVEAYALHANNWRLPTRVELLSLVDDTRFTPAIDPIFECESRWYWTSTPFAESPSDCAWIVGFSGGNSGWNGRDNNAFVRAVRPSQ